MQVQANRGAGAAALTPSPVRLVPALVATLVGFGLSFCLTRHRHLTPMHRGLAVAGSSVLGFGLGYLLGSSCERVSQRRGQAPQGPSPASAPLPEVVVGRSSVLPQPDGVANNSWPAANGAPSVGAPSPKLPAEMAVRVQLRNPQIRRLLVFSMIKTFLFKIDPRRVESRNPQYLEFRRLLGQIIAELPVLGTSTTARLEERAVELLGQLRNENDDRLLPFIELCYSKAYTQEELDDFQYDGSVYDRVLPLLLAIVRDQRSAISDGSAALRDAAQGILSSLSHGHVDDRMRDLTARVRLPSVANPEHFTVEGTPAPAELVWAVEGLGEGQEGLPQQQGGAPAQAQEANSTARASADSIG
jgi:hypothetical protein